jgi:ABC transport system ATP-binding/permease protein
MNKFSSCADLLRYMATPLLGFEGLGLVQGSGWLFRGLDLFVGDRDRLALVGRNGAGKTTLLKLIAGQIDYDEGRRSIVPGKRVVLLEQEPRFDGFETLLDFVLSGPQPPERHEAEAIADQLGVDLSRSANGASGGERRRAGLVRAFAMEPDLLLLDEPTNHLDLAGIRWLEEWLGRFRGAFITISHDRTFLTKLTRSTLWIDRGALRRTDIGFGGFEAWQERVFAEEARAADKLDAKPLARTRGDRSAQAQSRAVGEIVGDASGTRRDDGASGCREAWPSD